MNGFICSDVLQWIWICIQQRNYLFLPFCDFSLRSFPKWEGLKNNGAFCCYKMDDKSPGTKSNQLWTNGTVPNRRGEFVCSTWVTTQGATWRFLHALPFPICHLGRCTAAWRTYRLTKKSHVDARGTRPSIAFCFCFTSERKERQTLKIQACYINMLNLYRTILCQINHFYRSTCSFNNRWDAWIWSGWMDVEEQVG